LGTLRELVELGQEVDGFPWLTEAAIFERDTRHDLQSAGKACSHRFAYFPHDDKIIVLTGIAAVWATVASNANAFADFLTVSLRLCGGTKQASEQPAAKSAGEVVPKTNNRFVPVRGVVLRA